MFRGRYFATAIFTVIFLIFDALQLTPASQNTFMLAAIGFFVVSALLESLMAVRLWQNVRSQVLVEIQRQNKIGNPVTFPPDPDFLKRDWRLRMEYIVAVILMTVFSQFFVDAEIVKIAGAVAAGLHFTAYLLINRALASEYRKYIRAVILSQSAANRNK